MPEPGYISDRETLERLVRLETEVRLKVAEWEKALVLAREMADAERCATKSILEHRLEGMNEFQKRMDRLEATFATKSELATLQKYIYYASGFLFALWMAFKFLLSKGD